MPKVSMSVPRIMALALAFCLCGVCLGSSMTSLAEEKQEKIETVYVVVQEDRSISIVYDGKDQRLRNEHGQDVYPFTYLGTTYLPVRAISNILGNDVDWDGETRTITITPSDK